MPLPSIDDRALIALADVVIRAMAEDKKLRKVLASARDKALSCSLNAKVCDMEAARTGFDAEACGAAAAFIERALRHARAREELEEQARRTA